MVLKTTTNEQAYNEGNGEVGEGGMGIGDRIANSVCNRLGREEGAENRGCGIKSKKNDNMGDGMLREGGIETGLNRQK